MTEFSPKAIEQLNQTVREVSRRVRNEAPPRARWQKRKAPASTGGSSGGGGLATNNCCGTIYQAGSVDLDGLEWATDYTITLAAPIGTVTVTDQGSGTWESDAIDVTCTVDEVTVTDEYTVTMTATGNAPGEVIVTVALTSGGGYGGASGCCETTEGGFAWKYVNCCIVDPLAGWSMTRDPSGFSGKECELGGCEICVTPVRNTVPCGDNQIPDKYLIEMGTDGVGVGVGEAANGESELVHFECSKSGRCVYSFIDSTGEFVAMANGWTCTTTNFADYVGYVIVPHVRHEIKLKPNGKYENQFTAVVQIQNSSGFDIQEEYAQQAADRIEHDTIASALEELQSSVFTLGSGSTSPTPDWPTTCVIQWVP